MVRSEGNPVTPPGIDPGTVGLVAQRLNHYATPDPKGNLRETFRQTLLCENTTKMNLQEILMGGYVCCGSIMLKRTLNEI
jgi:hypothetical protein